MLERVVAAGDRSFEIRSNDLLVVSQGKFVESPDCGDSGVVDPHIELAELGDDCSRQFSDIRGLTNVCRDNEALPTCRLTFAGDFVQYFFASSGENNVSTTLRQF